MKKILFFLFFLITLNVYAQKQSAPLNNTACSIHVPYGEPTLVSTNSNTKLVCRTGYYLLSDLSAKIPVWVAYTLTPEHAIGCVTRSNAFSSDKSLDKNLRADPKDYVNSGYDIGHMANDGDMSWDLEVERESFILTNMSPQLPFTNRDIWRELESSVRAWAYERNHTLLIYVGPIYDIKLDKTIGDDKIVIPHAFYKIVIDTTTLNTIGFIYQNATTGDLNIKSHQVSVAEIEKETHIKFSLPPNINSTQLDSLDNWPVDFGEFTKAKQNKCKTIIP
jgi:endonuclease G